MVQKIISQKRLNLYSNYEIKQKLLTVLHLYFTGDCAFFDTFELKLFVEKKLKKLNKFEIVKIKVPDKHFIVLFCLKTTLKFKEFSGIFIENKISLLLIPMS